MSLTATYEMKSLTAQEFQALYNEARDLGILPFEVSYYVQAGNRIAYDTDFVSSEQVRQLESFLAAFKLYKRVREAGFQADFPQLRDNGEIVFEAEIPQEFALQF